MANEASDDINFIVSEFEMRIRKQTRELNMIYNNVQVKVVQCMNSMTDLVARNREGVSQLMEDGKVRFAMFDMKRRNFGGSNPGLRPILDSLWGSAMVQDWGEMPNHLKKFKFENLNRESIYEEIYKKRNTRKIQPMIGFTLMEEIKKAQIEYLRNHGHMNVTMDDGPKENQTMSDYCSAYFIQ